MTFVVLLLLGSGFTVGTLLGIRAVQRGEQSPGERRAHGWRLIRAGLAITCGAVLAGRIFCLQGPIAFLWGASLMIGSAVFFVGYSQIERAKIDEGKPHRG